MRQHGGVYSRSWQLAIRAENAEIAVLAASGAWLANGENFACGVLRQAAPLKK